ncbi:MAG: carbon-nitrogen hydrolase family protein [Elusimicrobiota bacterium]
MKFREFITESKIDGFSLLERTYSKDDSGLSVGLGNIHAIVPGIEENKTKIERACKIFKDKGCNMAVFPEFCLAGYFWEDQEACWPYMEKAVIEEHKDWMKNNLETMLDDNFQFIIFNNIRKGKEKKYLNSTYVVNKKLDYFNPKWIYDKIMLPGIEKIYTETGQDDRLIIESKWGTFGFTSCYDMCFSQLYQEMSLIDKVDAVIQIASWRGTAERDYPGMNVATDQYYGFLWDLLASSRSVTNQVWIIACNAVGVHPISKAVFWGGSGVWAPSGMKLIQGSNNNEELLIIHNLGIKEQKEFEQDDFDYSIDFSNIYREIKGKRSFTRL